MAATRYLLVALLLCAAGVVPFLADHPAVPRSYVSGLGDAFPGPLTALPWVLLDQVDILEGVREAEKRFGSGERTFLAVGHDGMWLAGIEGEPGAVFDSCRVIYVESPSDGQREGLISRFGSMPARPRGVSPGLDAVECSTKDGGSLTFPVKVVASGCILDASYFGFNRRMLELVHREHRRSLEGA